MKNKVQVWILTQKEVLIFLTNKKRGNFWQPVTGSAESFDLQLKDAAIREVKEETGFIKDVEPLNHQFHFLNQFGEETSEHGFYILLDEKENPILDPNEHDSFQWVSFDEALKRIRFDSNKEMLKILLIKELKILDPEMA